MKNAKSEDGTSVAYHTSKGGAHGPIFVHGWMTSGVVWEGFVGELEGVDARCVVPDLRGTGDSEEADDYTLQRYAEDVTAVAAEAGIDRFDIVGHSMGGQIAQWVAAEWPDRVRKLVLIAPVPASGLELPEEARELFSSAGGDRDRLGAILDQASPQLGDDHRERLLDAAVQISGGCIRASFETWSGASFSDRLSAIEAQTLVIAGDDPFLPPEMLEETVVAPIPDARLEHIPDAGHYVHLEKATETRARVVPFL